MARKAYTGSLQNRGQRVAKKPKAEWRVQQRLTGSRIGGTKYVITAEESIGLAVISVQRLEKRAMAVGRRSIYKSSAIAA